MRRALALLTLLVAGPALGQSRFIGTYALDGSDSGTPPGGSGTELQFRLGATFGAALGSSVTPATGAITLTSQGAAVTPLTIVPHASQTARLLDVGGTMGIQRVELDTSSNFGLVESTSGTTFGAARPLGWSASFPTGAPDVGLARASAGLLKVTSGGSNLGSIQAGNYTATALGTPTITAPLTVNGTPGATTYGYKAVAFLNDGTSSAASAEVTTATGPAVLDGTDNITVAVPAVANMAYYNLYRTTGGAAPPKLIYSGTTPSYIDVGTEISAETPATKNTTGYAVAARAKITGLASYANNAAALAAGLVAGDLYTITGSDPLALAVVY